MMPIHVRPSLTTSLFHLMPTYIQSLPEIDLGLSEGAKVLTHSMRSLTKGLSKNLLGGSKKSKTKAPKKPRILFQDDEDDDDEIGGDADPIGLPPRRKALEEKEASSLSSSSSSKTSSTATTASSSSTARNKKVSLFSAADGDDDDEDDEDGHGDWLASLKRRGSSTGSRPQPTLTGLAQRRRGQAKTTSRSLFGK